MRRLAKHAGKYLFLLLMLVCFGHILSTGTQINGYGTPVIYYMDDSPYTLDTVMDMKKNDEQLDNYLPFTAVGSMDNQTFSNPDLNKTLECQMIYIYGSSSLVCLSSGELMDDDLTGCILSSAAAWQLFGETGIIGGEVIYNNRTYYVRGVYENETPGVIVPALTVFAKEETSAAAEDTPYTDIPEPGVGNMQEASFDKILVKPSNNEESGNVRSEYIQAFENRWGLGGGKTDCLIYQRLASFFMMLIPALIFIYVMLSGLQFIYSHRFKPFWMIAGTAGLIIMFAAYFLICRTSPSIPPDLIPNRWSDFDFWGDLITTFKNSIQHILFLNKSEIELAYFKPLTSLIGYTVTGVILFFAANSCFKVCDSLRFFLVMAGTCVTELIAVYLLQSAELMMGTKQMLLYLWPYLLVGKYIFQKNISINSNKSS